MTQSPALHVPFHVPLQDRRAQREGAAHGPALCLSSGDGSLALLQWVSDTRVLRQLAAGTADGHFSGDDLCLQTTGLASNSYFREKTQAVIFFSNLWYTLCKSKEREWIL